MGYFELAGILSMKVAVYTCITNGYDEVCSPKTLTEGVDYLCFTDGSVTVPSPWIGIKIDFPYSGRDANRYVKIQPHIIKRLKGYDLTIYVDGVIEIVGNLMPLIQQVMRTDAHTFMYEHPQRNCAFKEARSCVVSMKAPIYETAKMVSLYRDEGFPDNFGLFECGVIIRKTGPEIEPLMEKWWESYKAGIKRDQFALMYASWKTGTPIRSLGVPDHRFESRYFFCKTGHKGDFFRRHFAWWVWRPLISSFIYLKNIKL